MPLNDVDVLRRRFSIGMPMDLVDFVVYSYDESTCDVKHIESVAEVIDLIENHMTNEKVHWIEVINRSSVDLPDKVQALCDYLEIHPLTVEDISTLTTLTKLDLFYEQAAIYLLLKIVSYSGDRVDQKQISFYLKSSQNLLITFQEQITGKEVLFADIRSRLQYERNITEENSSIHPHNKIRRMNVDYLFYCLFDAIIDRGMVVLEEISNLIGKYDEMLMKEKRASTLASLQSIHRLRHDLLYLRILFQPLKEILHRLQRVRDSDAFVSVLRTQRLRRLDLKHQLVRRKPSTARLRLLATTVPIIAPMIKKPSLTSSRRTSIFLTDHIHIYLGDLNDHIDHLIDFLEIQRESAAMLISFWMALNASEAEKVLKLLMLITVPFMPCMTLIGINSMNYHNEPPLHYANGYFIVLGFLGTILLGMLTWYKLKRWI